MPTGDVKVQGAVHSLEQGRMAIIIKGGMCLALLVVVTLLYLFVQFRGLNSSTAMDQAQIARNIAAGQGFTTDYIRPLAIGTLKSAGKANEAIDAGKMPDFYQSPLWPAVNALPLRIIKDTWQMTRNTVDYPGDRMIAFMAVVCFLLSVGVFYFVFTRLFDKMLALYACAAILLTDIMWQFSLSGLPQMLLLLLFSIGCLLTLLAEEAQENDAFIPTVALLVGAGVVFGLMILTHGLAVWIFLGWLAYTGFIFRPRGLMCLAAVGAALIVVSPWLVRNYQVCGNPLGISYMAMFYDAPPEQGYLRSEDAPGKNNPMGLFRRGSTRQLDVLFSYFGLNIAAGAFFLAAFHRFRNPRTSAFRWGLLLMWVMAFIGMSFFRVDGAISSNQIHIIFLPLFTCYGFAFLMVMWSRWELGQGLLRTIFVGLVIFLCSVPLLMTLFAGSSGRVQWPPYIPPFIGILGEWFTEDEIIASDMPWAVAWYAQRSSLLLPESVREFNRMHDYQDFKQPIRGLYLTPVTGNQPLFSGIYKGSYKEWALLITRPPQIKGFPLPAFTPLPIDGECIIFADRDRWTTTRSAE